MPIEKINHSLSEFTQITVYWHRHAHRKNLPQPHGIDITIKKHQPQPQVAYKYNNLLSVVKMMLQDIRNG
jgi:hypothetical protein